MVSLLTDPSKVRPLLDAEHELNAMVIDRVFSRGEDKQILTDNEKNPHGVMVIIEDDPKHVCIYADDEDAFLDLLKSLESGKKYQFSGLRDIFFPSLEKEFEIAEINPCWMFVLPEGGLRGEVHHEITSLKEEDVEFVAENWEHFSGAYEHVRDRILNGDTVAFRAEGKLIGWDATHFETDKVIMLGFLFVMEGYRKQGIAISLCVSLTRRILEKGKIPIFYVMKDNEPSIKFSLKLGFEIVDSHSWVSGVKR